MSLTSRPNTQWRYHRGITVYGYYRCNFNIQR